MARRRHLATSLSKGHRPDHWMCSRRPGWQQSRKRMGLTCSRTAGRLFRKWAACKVSKTWGSQKLRRISWTYGTHHLGMRDSPPDVGGTHRERSRNWLPAEPRFSGVRGAPFVTKLLMGIARLWKTGNWSRWRAPRQPFQQENGDLSREILQVPCK